VTPRIVLTAILASTCLLAADIAPPKVVMRGDGYFPVMVRLKDGTLLTVLRAGAPHIGRKGRLDLISSKDGGKTWPQRWTAIDDGEDDRNPAMGQLADGTIVLAFCVLSGFDASGLKLLGKRTERKFDGVWVMRSKDGGKTWTKPEKSQATDTQVKGHSAISAYGKIIQLKDGTALMTVYYEIPDGPDKARFESYVFRSKDGGKTWGEASLILKDGNETSLAVLPDGSVLAAVRTSNAGYLNVLRSTDGGRTWGAPTRVTKNREHPADLIVLKDGRVVMTFGERNPPRGVHAMLSADGGKTWTPSDHIVLANDSPNTDCGYPSSWEVSPGRVLTIYYQVDDLKSVPASASARTVTWTVPAK
jgi:Neuraminidase (sialidase)